MNKKPLNILIDIGHPAHVHYFKQIIFTLKSQGHNVVVAARNKEVTTQLLDTYQIPYYNKGKGSSSWLGRFFYLFKSIFLLSRLSSKFKPDIYLSCTSPYAAIVAWLFNKPHWVFDDTELDRFTRKVYLPFSSKVITPASYELDLGAKHIKLNSYFELNALYNFKANENYVYNLLNIEANSKIALLRFVSWGAFHDKGQKGLDDSEKRELINFLIKNDFKVFISSENKLPLEFEPYQLQSSPDKLHDVIAAASLCITEGATIATESIILGTPTVYINTLNCGNQKELEKKYGLVNLRTGQSLLKHIEPLLEHDAKKAANKHASKLKSEKSNINEWLINELKAFDLTKKKRHLSKFYLVSSFIYFSILLLVYIYPFDTSYSLNRYELVFLRADHLFHLLVFIPIPFLLIPSFKKTGFNFYLTTFLVAFFFETIHLILPYRAFTFADLFSNLLGVGIGLLILTILQFKKSTLRNGNYR